MIFCNWSKLCLFALNWRSVRFQNPSCIVRQRMTESFPFPGQRENTAHTGPQQLLLVWEISPQPFLLHVQMLMCSKMVWETWLFCITCRHSKNPFQKVPKTKCHPYHQPPPWGQRRWWLWQKTTNSSATAVRPAIRWTGFQTNHKSCPNLNPSKKGNFWSELFLLYTFGTSSKHQYWKRKWSFGKTIWFLVSSMPGCWTLMVRITRKFLVRSSTFPPASWKTSFKSIYEHVDHFCFQYFSVW